VSGTVLSGPVNARNRIAAFLQTTPNAYTRVTYDLDTNFRNSDYRNVLQRLGSEAWAVPADAHWPSAAEKSIELVQTELDAAIQEFPELTPDSALKIAVLLVNSRALWAHNVTRATVHFGRDVARQTLSSQLFAQSPEWIPLSMSDIEVFLNASDGKRRNHEVHTVRMRLQTALRQRTVRLDPLFLQNGDMSLFWWSGTSAGLGGYKGPAVCIGQHRSLVIGFQGGHLVTAHTSRFLLHRRGPQFSSPNADVMLPASRESLKTPLVLNDDFKTQMETDGPVEIPMDSRFAADGR
jgi:hypothetical protein